MTAVAICIGGALLFGTVGAWLAFRKPWAWVLVRDTGVHRYYQHPDGRRRRVDHHAGGRCRGADAGRDRRSGGRRGRCARRARVGRGPA